MAEKNNATCSICGRGYHKCLSCRDAMKLQPWKMFTDTAECYKVFQVIKGFSTGVYSKDEFKSKLKTVDLSDLENYRDHIKILIKDALKEEVNEEPIVEEVVVVPHTSRKRNYKVNKVESSENAEVDVADEVDTIVEAEIEVETETEAE